MNGGDTFRLSGVADRHTWVVISDPAQDPNKVLIVSFTSYTGEVGMDASCIVETDEFSILTNRSCIYYEDLREASVTSLELIKKGGKLQMRGPVSAALLRKIRDGAISSIECKEKYKDLLKKQGVVTSGLARTLDRPDNL